MTIKQLSVFLENREGRLDEVLKTLGANDVNIVALSLADTADYGMRNYKKTPPIGGCFLFLSFFVFFLFFGGHCCQWSRQHAL